MAFDPFSVFTGAPAKQAANDARGYLASIGQSNRGFLDEARLSASQDLTGGFNAARDVYGSALGSGNAAINAGYTDAMDMFNAGGNALQGQYDTARADLVNARDAFAPMSALGQKYGAATTMGLNALGVNGQDGMTAARSAFTAGPAYNFNMEQGLDAINRAQNARGMANSGNTDRDAQKFGAELASNEYDKWLGNLLGFTNPELAATSCAATGIAGANTNMANLSARQGDIEAARAVQGANLATGRGAMLADLATRYGTNVGGNYTNEGTAMAGLRTGTANNMVQNQTALAQPYSQTYGQEAAAEMQGAGNLWSLGMNAAKLAAGMPAGTFGGGNPMDVNQGYVPFISGGGYMPAR